MLKKSILAISIFALLLLGSIFSVKFDYSKKVLGCTICFQTPEKTIYDKKAANSGLGYVFIAKKINVIRLPIGIACLAG